MSHVENDLLNPTTNSGFKYTKEVYLKLYADEFNLIRCDEGPVLVVQQWLGKGYFGRNGDLMDGIN